MNYIQQAYKGENDWWRYFVSCIVLFAPFALNILAYIFMPELFDTAYEDMQNIEGDKNFFLVINLIPFVFLLLLLIVFVKFIHQRRFTSLVTSRDRIDWSRFFYAFFLWGLISAVIIAVGIWLAPDNFIWNFKPAPFFTLVIVSLLLIPLQTSFEELFFRGYLMQGIGILVKNRWMPLIVTSVLFGSMHWFNPEIEKIGDIALVFYIGTGFLFGITTLMDEGTELALGMHAVNNILAAVLVTTDWTVFQTEAMFVDVSEPSVGWEMFFPVLVIYPLVLVILSKKYGWKNWKSKLFGSIEKPTEIEELGMS
ncbi:CPBP family intramembrane glutamic endopeptidase [Flavobacteriaceae bacterium S356]|uniref:CPBP family intramembrane glutamic endopeptidase n=1 Tax=Asprobacillus argus TaxID=3076534 RepID=A0ABU3LGZ0_9FLAO|nr:CPBP family intramembrane glutamic endopeptidase [Flavobacteriaceae bacterium S356]